MKALVFVGPTLEAHVIPEILDADVAGPVRFGDVYRAVLQGRRAIAIIDGYFEHVPAVWHKEILWAMSEGVHVLGASSMGALRAAELHVFGMVGIGSTYEAFRSGTLEDDDEVAVAHASAENQYRSLSDAMVNIRATLDAAVNLSVIGDATRNVLIEVAKRTFYARRSYARVMEEATALGADGAEILALRNWLPRGKVDQKREDAVALLKHLRDWMTQTPVPKRVNYRFEATDSWHEATRLALGEDVSDLNATVEMDGMLEEELKLAGAYEGALEGAAARGLALELAMRAGARPDSTVVQQACSEFRFRRGLRRRNDFELWRSAQRLENDELVRFFETEARLSWARPLKEGIARSHMVDYLRARGQYGEWLERLSTKAEKLRRAGVVTPSLADVEMSETELWRWYFRDCCGRDVPADLDAFAVSAGFREGKEQLRAAVLREAYARTRCAQNISE
jgi:hypothetical protein